MICTIAQADTHHGLMISCHLEGARYPICAHLHRSAMYQPCGCAHDKTVPSAKRRGAVAPSGKVQPVHGFAPHNILQRDIKGAKILIGPTTIGKPKELLSTHSHQNRQFMGAAFRLGRPALKMTRSIQPCKVTGLHLCGVLDKGSHLHLEVLDVVFHMSAQPVPVRWCRPKGAACNPALNEIILCMSPARQTAQRQAYRSPCTRHHKICNARKGSYPAPPLEREIHARLRYREYTVDRTVPPVTLKLILTCARFSLAPVTAAADDTVLTYKRHINHTKGAIGGTKQTIQKIMCGKALILHELDNL